MAIFKCHSLVADDVKLSAQIPSRSGLSDSVGFSLQLSFVTMSVIKTTCHINVLFYY